MLSACKGFKPDDAPGGPADSRLILRQMIRSSRVGTPSTELATRLSCAAARDLLTECRRIAALPRDDLGKDDDVSQNAKMPAVGIGVLCD